MKTFVLIAFSILLLFGKLYSQNGKKYILLEEFSTAPCGFCPDGDLIAAQLVHDHPEIIWMTHHAGFGTDSMTINESKAIAKDFTTFAPGAAIDRMYVPIPVYTKEPFIAISRQKWDSVSTAHLSDNALVDVIIDNQYNANTKVLTCTVAANFIEAPATGDIRLNVFIVEDSVVGEGHGYDQKSYFNKQSGHPLYGMGDTIFGYVHHRVVRYSATGNWGLEGVIPNTPETGKDYSQSFTITIPKNWKTKDLDVVAFISYYNSNPKERDVINSNHKMVLDPTSGLIIENQTLNNFSVFPNPYHDGQLNVSGDFDINQSLEIDIYNSLGQNVFKTQQTPNGSDVQIQPLKVLETGLYFVRISQGSKSQIMKLVVK